MAAFELRTPDTRLRVLIDGDGPEDLLLIGGVGEGADAWDSQASAFAGRYRVIRYDTRGIGLSPRPPASSELDQHVRDAIEVLDAAGSRRAHLVGSSFGSAIAQWVAIDRPERAISLTLSGGYARPDEAFRLLAARWSRLAERSARPGGLLVAINHAAYSRDSWENGFAPARVEAGERALEADPEAWTDFREAVGSSLTAALEHDSSRNLGRLGLPVLIVAGEHDAVLPIRHSEELAALIPHAQFALVAGAGHQVFEERPDEFNRQLGAFLVHAQRAEEVAA